MKKSLATAIEYSLSFLLLALNLVNYQWHVNRFIFLAAGSALFVSLFWICFQKVQSFPAACAMMLCHTWQISWYNVFGESTSVLQLPWFYVVGAMIVLYCVYNYKKIYTTKVNLYFLAAIVFIYIIGTIPLILSPSKAEGLKEYIMIMYYVTLVAAAFMNSGSVKGETAEYVFDAYTFAVAISCFFLIFQSLVYSLTGVVLFYQSQGSFFGNATLTVGLLMGDLSSATIMLGSAVFICISRIEKKRAVLLNAASIVIIVIGMALTSRRTSTVSLIIVLAAYALTHYKNVFKKVMACLLFAIVANIMLYYFQKSRPVDDISMLFYENERFANYFRVFEVTAKNLLGVGYDTVHANSFMTDNIAPHNTFLRWTLMGGPLFSIALAIVPVYSLITAYKKKLMPVFWIILYSLVASNFIPDLLTARFFVIPCICAFLFEGKKSTNKKLLLQRR